MFCIWFPIQVPAVGKVTTPDRVMVAAEADVADAVVAADAAGVVVAVDLKSEVLIGCEDEFLFN